MKYIGVFIIAICLFASCNTTSDSGGQQLKSNGNGFVNDSSANKGVNNEQMTRDPETAKEMGEVNNQPVNNDSAKMRADEQRRVEANEQMND